MWHGWGVIQTFHKCFIPFILSYKIKINTDLLRCTANQVGAGHKLHFSAQTSSFGQIGSNQQLKWLWNCWGVIQAVQRCFISLILPYKIRNNTALLRCTASQVGTYHKIRFQPKNPSRAKLAAINNKNGCDTAEVWCRYFGIVSYHWYYHIRSIKRNLCSVVPPTKSAQAISSISAQTSS